MHKIFSIVLSIFLGSAVVAQEIAIVPQPQSLETGSGSFPITAQTPIIVNNDADRNAADFLNQYLSTFYDIELPVQPLGQKGIFISTGTFPSQQDGYLLVSDNQSVRIVGNTAAGTFLGVQTLIQLLPVEKQMALSVPAVRVADAPALRYRGVHLDVSRHFMPVDFIKKYIDYIALHKMNFFHWHLTDDQGWRIEIKKYPKLTETGAWRHGTIIGAYPGSGNDGQRYGGFYTQEEVKDVVAYAAKRHVTVVPEIELPGHASAAIAAYPYLSCFPEQSTAIADNTPWAGPRDGKQVQQTWGVFDDIFCAGKETTFTFLEDVISEVMPLFPSKYFHIGGDEAPKTHWKKCSECQKRIKELGIKGDKDHQAEHYLQSYCVQRMEKFLSRHGKSLIGWDEILEGGLAPNAIVMSWRGEQGGIAAAKEHHEVIMTPVDYVYFDYQQAKHDDSVTISNNRWHLPIEKVYMWKVVPQALTEAQFGFVLGGQANMWTEYIKNPEKVEYMLFPRIAALSEALWTPQEKRNQAAFDIKLKAQKKRYDLWGVNYYNK